MSSEVDLQIERAREMMQRIGGDYRHHGKAVRRRAASAARRLATIAAANAAILIAAVVVGLVIPLGIFGALAVLMLMVAATLMIALAPAPRPPRAETLRDVDIRALPAQTGRWLHAQRPALPAPARGMVDRIGVALEGLSPQLGRVEAEGEAAYEIRRLIGEQLPAFVADYERVPASLRRVERNGRTPDAELVDGLKLIEREIADMSQRLAQGDLDQLQTRGRYLEMKYKDGGER